MSIVLPYYVYQVDIVGKSVDAPPTYLRRWRMAGHVCQHCLASILVPLKETDRWGPTAEYSMCSLESLEMDGGTTSYIHGTLYRTIG